MGLRFRKTIGIIPGLRLNLSKGGVSASVGGKGATVNIGSKGVTGTVGVPGTGLSYRKSLTPTGLELARKGRWGKWWLLAIVAVAALALFYARRELPKLAAPTPATGSASAQSAARSDPARSVAGTAAVSARSVAGTAAVSARSVAGTAAVSAKTANCRATPARGGRVTAKLAQGEVVTVRERQEAWTHVSTGAGDCWVSNRTIRASDR